MICVAQFTLPLELGYSLSLSGVGVGEGRCKIIIVANPTVVRIHIRIW